MASTCSAAADQNPADWSSGTGIGFRRRGRHAVELGRAGSSEAHTLPSMATAVVTGAGQGLGRATAVRLAADGFTVVALDRNGDAAVATAKEVGGTGHTVDVRDRDAVQAVAAEIGPIQVLVNNAGIWRYSDLLSITPQDARDVLDVNLLGTLWCIQAFAPLIAANGGGSIVNFSSVAAAMRAPSVGIYSASKAAIEELTGQAAQSSHRQVSE
jgi:NAD(P)-dependent dehydrogenase (short-subunit alcohol dehydrogenase family)